MQHFEIAFESLCTDDDLSEASIQEIEQFQTFVNQHLNSIILRKRQEQKQQQQNQQMHQREQQMERIRQYLRHQFINYSDYYKESCVYPAQDSDGIFAGYNELNTADIDEFLFPSEDDIELLCNQGIISKHYCISCGSKNIGTTKFISHSLGRRDIDFIFSDNCVGSDLRGKVVCDVGSRLGSILFYAYIFTNASEIIGIEINDKFVELQNHAMRKFQLENDDRIKLYNQDFLKCGEIAKQCDIFIMHNVFEWFCSREDHVEIWKKLISGSFFNRGALIVTVPSIKQSLLDCGLDPVELHIDSWVRQIELDRSDLILEEERQDPTFSVEQSIHLYEVL
jgi:hypothetical protein